MRPLALFLVVLSLSGCFRFHADSLFSYCKELYKVELSEEELKKSLLGASTLDSRIDFKDDYQGIDTQGSAGEKEAGPD